MKDNKTHHIAIQVYLLETTYYKKKLLLLGKRGPLLSPKHRAVNQNKYHKQWLWFARTKDFIVHYHLKE